MIDRTNSLSSNLLSLLSSNGVAGSPPQNAASEEVPPGLEAPPEETPALRPDWANQFLSQYQSGQIDPELLRQTISKQGTAATQETTRTEETQEVELNRTGYGSEQEARQTIANKAIAYAGTGADNEREAYLDLLTGPKDAKNRQGMLSKSSCALFARGVLRESGCESSYLDKFQAVHKVVNPETKKTTHVTNAVQDVIKAAKEKEAWVTPKFERGRVPDLSELPKMGDTVMIYNPDKNGSEHVMVFTGDPRPDPNHPGDFLVNTAEGGQGDYKKSNDHSDSFGTAPGVSRESVNGKENPPRRMRLDGKGKLRTITRNETTGAVTWKRQVFGYADAGKLMGPYRG